MIWRWLASVVVVLVLLATGAVVLVATTEPGAAWLAGEVQALTDDAVRLQGIRGTLRGGLQVDELDVHAGTTAVHAQAVTLRISLRNLLRGRLLFRELRVQRLDLTVMTDPAAPPGPFRMPMVAAPLPMELLDLRLATLRIRVNDSTLQLERIGLAADWSGTRLRVHRLGAAMAGLSVGISGAATLVPDLPLDARVAWRWRKPALSGTGRINGDLTVLQIQQRIAVPDAVAVSGTLSDLAGVPRLNATAHWDSVQADAPGLGALRSTAGHLTLDGGLSTWQATLETSLQGASLPLMQARARVHGDRERLVLERLRLNGAFGDAAARGVLDLQPAQRLRLDIIASNVNTEVLRAGLRGELSARARLDATVGGEVGLQLRELRGQLMDRPLSGTGDLAYREGSATFSHVDLRAGPNRLRADGSIGQRLSGRFDLDAPQLQVLWPDLSGSLRAHARVAGTRAEPVIDVDGEGRAVVMAGNRVERLNLRARVDRGQHVDASLTAQGIEMGEQPLGDLDASLLGTMQRHRLSAALAGPALQVRLASAGRWTGTALMHRLEEASITVAEIGAWQLAGQPDFSVAADAAAIGPHCWRQAPTELCVASASWTPLRTRLSAELRELELQRFDRWLGEDLAVTGRADGALTLDISGGDISGSASWRQRGTTLYYTGGDEPLLTPLETVEFHAEATPAQATASLRLVGAEGLRLEATGRMEGPPGKQAPLQGRLVGLLPDVAPLLPWLAADLDLAEVAGRITLDASVSGSLGSPRLAGEVRFAGGAAALPGVGIKLEAIDLALLGDGSDALKLRGSAMAGGPLTLAGELRPLESAGPAGWVRIRGDRIDAVRLPDRYVQASPDFTLRYASAALSVEGEILIPRAEIVVRQLPESAASPSADAVVMDRDAPALARAPGKIIGGELALTLGRDVRLKAFGLDTLLEGTVKLSQGSDGEPKGFGVVRLREGKFGAYGKELTIERGTLGFAGPLDDPAVDLRASRRVDWEGRNVTAGIVVSGTASRPESRVFSDPSMSEADAISYLISGRPMQSANATDRSAIAGAALSLGAAQTSPLTQKVGSAVTLDELAVEGSTLDETQVVAGKQLGSDLYVRFAYGLFNRIGTVLARYKIGRNLSIEAASGEDQSLDLIYSVERE